MENAQKSVAAISYWITVNNIVKVNLQLLLDAFMITEKAFADTVYTLQWISKTNVLINVLNSITSKQ